MYKKNGRTAYKSNRRTSFKKPGGYKNFNNRNRGNVSQQYNKYLKLAKEASRSGDRIQSEYYYQFTDHYYRIMVELGINIEENAIIDDQKQSTSNEQTSETDNETIEVNNNDKVKFGDLLILLEDIELNNNYNLAKQSLQVTQKELLRSRQSSFSNNEEKARLAELVAQVELKKAEVASAEEKLKNTKLFAKQKGIAIVDQKNDWQGRPVKVGEKIMTVANPDEVEFLIWLPVKDSLVIKENSKVKVFLDVNPISSLKGKLLRASYAPSLSPEEVLSYKIGASFDGKKPPRIGFRGTAKVYGSRVPLFYFVLRKPITFMRQYIGI